MGHCAYAVVKSLPHQRRLYMEYVRQTIRPHLDFRARQGLGIMSVQQHYCTTAPLHAQRPDIRRARNYNNSIMLATQLNCRDCLDAAVVGSLASG